MSPLEILYFTLVPLIFIIISIILEGLDEDEPLKTTGIIGSIFVLFLTGLFVCIGGVLGDKRIVTNREEVKPDYVTITDQEVIVYVNKATTVYSDKYADVVAFKEDRGIIIKKWIQIYDPFGPDQGKIEYQIIIKNND